MWKITHTHALAFLHKDIVARLYVEDLPSDLQVVILHNEHELSALELTEQIIFDLDRNAPEVRLNSEVNAVMSARATRPIAKGEAVTVTDFSEIDSIHLAAERDPNAAHLTLVLHRGNFEILPIPESVPHTVFADTPGLILRAAARTDEISQENESSRTREPRRLESPPTTETITKPIAASVGGALKRAEGRNGESQPVVRAS